MGKSYAARKPVSQRPESDFYRTPESLTQLLCDTYEFGCFDTIYEPMAGDDAIADILRLNEYDVATDDIRTTGKNFLEFDGKVEYIVTNPAFSIFDETIQKCQEVCEHGYTLLGKTNFFGAYGRYKQGLWKNLKHVYIFNRQVDYRTPPEQNGNFCVGNLITGWFVFDKGWKHDCWNTSIMDVQPWATLGSYDNFIRGQNDKI